MSCGLVALSLLPLVAVAQPPCENQGSAAPPPQMQQMQSHMQAMQEQMTRIHATTDPE
jgi:hypothetical protein